MLNAYPYNMSGVEILNREKQLYNMEKLKVYQIGLGGFGRYGFEKLIEIDKHFDEVDVELCGVAEADFEKRARARKFAGSSNIEIDFYTDVSEMYYQASKEDEKVLIYDAGPSNMHAEHIYESIDRGFFHLAEKPPSLTREEHLKERKMADRKEVFWMVDFIERENPVVKKTLDILSEEDLELDEINIFRESSVGVQKVLEPVERSGVQGGDILDKMTHEIYALDFLEAANVNPAMDLQQAEAEYLMPKGIVSDKLMDVRGGYTDTLDDSVATGQSRAKFRATEVDINLHSSWMGISGLTREVAERISEKLDHTLVNSEYYESEEEVFWNEEARFFEIKGDTHLLGDMLHGKLFDLEKQEEIQTPSLMHDQLYRVIEKAVLKASGKDGTSPESEKIGIFMNGIFDARDEILSGEMVFSEELSRGKERLREHIIDVDENVLEIEFSDEIIGIP